MSCHAFASSYAANVAGHSGSSNRPIDTHSSIDKAADNRTCAAHMCHLLALAPMWSCVYLGRFRVNGFRSIGSIPTKRTVAFRPRSYVKPIVNLQNKTPKHWLAGGRTGGRKLKKPGSGGRAGIAADLEIRQRSPASDTQTQGESHAHMGARTHTHARTLVARGQVGAGEGKTCAAIGARAERHTHGEENLFVPD